MAESGSKGRAGEKARPARKTAPKPRASSSKGGVAAASGARKVASRKSAPLSGSARSRTRPRPPAGGKPASASRRPASPKAKVSAVAPKSRPTPKPSPRKPAVVSVSKASVPVLNEEDQIRSAKFLPRDLPARLFEEERFLFPESYGVNRIRLLVKDPEWLFAHWDVDPKVLGEMKKAMGERAMALSRLTLRVVDPTNGGASDILLPPLARGWYIRADATRRSYKALLGVTLPSGEFRQLAESNVVVTPRVGPSRERAQKRITFGQAGRIPQDAGIAQRDEDIRSVDAGAGPWRAPSVDGEAPEAALGTGSPAAASAPTPATPARAGASDAFRPGGASDVYRR